MKPPGLRDKDIDVLCNTFRRFPTIREVRVFGSRAKGVASRRSDLDLAISSNESVASEWSALQEALEKAPLIYELDIVRLDSITSERLKERIAREGITIYQRED